MLKLWSVSVAILVAALTLTTRSTVAAGDLSPRQIVDHALAADPFGLTGGRVEAKIILRDKRGTESTLSFAALSNQYDPPLSRSVVRFSAPAELKGAGFLQIQKRGADDERFLFLPEIKRARRVSGNLRATSFMGTDFSYADLDRRDLREGSAVALAEATVGGAPCYGVEVRPSAKDSEYSRIELWVRKDTFLPMRMKMYDRGGTLLKTFTAEGITKVQGSWFIAKSKMTHHKNEHTTQLILEKIVVDKKVPADEFTVQALERI